MLRITQLTLLAARLLLAGVFLLAGTTKLVDPRGLRKALRGFGLPAALTPPAMLLLPVLELAVAVTLIPISLAWYAAWGALGLLIGFMITVGIAMVRGRKPDCHCFGQLHSAPVGWSTLIRNCALAACAVWLVWKGRQQAGPGIWAWLLTLDGSERKIALIAACALGFLFFRVVDRARPAGKAVEPDVGPRDEEEERPREEAAPAGSSANGIGLPIGTIAPEFELPALNGEKRTLRALREQATDVLLIFSNPFCEPCKVLASNLVRWTREMDGLPNVVLVSRGTAQENLAKLKDFDTSRVLLQPDATVSEAYDCNATPSAVLVGADGVIRSGLAVGGVAIKQLLSSCAKRGSSQAEKELVP